VARGGGYLYKRGDTYWGRLRISGRELSRSLRTSDSREAARRLKAWRVKVEREGFGDLDAPTFKAAVVKWAAEVLPQSVKPSVGRRYLTSIAKLDLVFGELRVDQVNAATIGQYVSLRTKNATNATIRRDLTALSRLMAACQAWGWRGDNPVKFYDRSVVLRERRDPITPPRRDDYDRVLGAVPDAMAKVLRLLDQTGMRENEAVALTSSDVDRDRRQIMLIRTKTSRPRTLDWVTPGGDATEAIAAGADHGTLFPSRSGEAYGNFASAFGAVMRRLVVAEKKAGRPFRRFRVHDLRHRFAIRWLRDGGGIYELSKHLGHTSVKTTEMYLAYLSAQEQTGVQTRGQRVVSQPRNETKDDIISIA
jgi:integrase/recombinase XerD